MTNAALGDAGVFIALFGAIAGVMSLVAGNVRRKPAWVRHGYSYAWLVVGGAVLATLAMERALLTHDFSLQYVVQNNSVNTPVLFTIAGMWSALEGSILLWGLVLAGFLGTMVWHFRSRRDDAMVSWATAVTLVVVAFFFGLMAGPASPFETISGVVPADGNGPNPLLQEHVLMAFHPPILYIGYVGFTVPFAFGIAALITGRLGEGWLVEVRRWTLVAWAFLTTGIMLGSWWSYEVLGWGGYWAWDPVENASLLPWLTATAYLHSVMVQERRGMLRVWNLSLLAATFSLTILGTFLTRSGVLDSVHAFSESSIGPLLLGFFGVIVASTCGLIFWRSEKLGSPGSIASAVSRESAFLVNNIVFAAFAFIVLLGTVFPLLADAISGDDVAIGSPYFNTMARPAGMVLLFLMAVAPMLPWRGASSATVRDRLFWPAAFSALVMAVCVVFGLRGIWMIAGFGLGALVAGSSVRQIALSVRRFGVQGFLGRTSGGMIAHLGFAILAVAVVASQSYQHRVELSLKPGESAVVSGHRIEFLGLQALQFENKSSTVAEVRVDGGKVYRPALSSFPNSNDAVGTPSVRTTPLEDVYLTLVRAPAESGGPSVISVIVQPLIMWLWIGGAVIAAGSLIALIPQQRRKLSTAETVIVTSVVPHDRETVRT
jgi:cytochrome c-type biogenesis protein CcmF